MRSPSALLLVLALLQAIPARAEETADESQSIQAIGRLGAKLVLDARLPGRPVVGIRFYGSGSFRDKDCHLLKPFRHLRSLNLGDCKITDAGLHEFRELRDLAELYLRRNRITDAGLKELRELKNLTTLELTGNVITDAGLKELRDLKKLTKLDLASTKITDVGLKQLRDLQRLTALDLSGNEITDSVLNELRNLADLTELDLGSTDVAGSRFEDLGNLKKLTKLNLSTKKMTDAGLKHVREFKRLTELSLDYTEVTDGGLEQLGELTDLARLSLRGSKVTGAGLAGLRRFKHLEQLGIEMTAANLRGLAAVTSLREVNFLDPETMDSDLEAVAELKNLAALNLAGANITARGLKELQRLVKLTKLDLHDSKITDAGLAEIAKLTNLTELNLSSTRITGAGFKDLCGLRNLRKLDLGRTKITDAPMNDLAGLTALAELDLSSTHITGAGLRELGRLESLAELKLTQINLTDDDAKELRGLKRLRNLDLSANKLTDAGLAELATLENLTTLNLSVNLITDAGLKQIGHLENLAVLDLSMTAITDAGLRELRQLKNLAELNLSYTDITGRGLTHLGELKKLTKLNLEGTRLTDDGLLGLRELKSLTDLELPDHADVYEPKFDIVVQGGWRVSPDFKRMIVPLWTKPPGATPRVLAPSYSPLAVFDLDRPNDARILPFTGVDAQALPAYLGLYTSWSKNSAALAYFGEFDSGDREIFGNRFDWHPVWLDLKTGKTVVLTSIDFGRAPLSGRAAIHLSPSGRYVLIPMLLDPSAWQSGRKFLLWEPAAGTVRELLRDEHASGWQPYDATLAWSGDEKMVYLAVGTSDGKQVESWRLCGCRLDGPLPYTPQTALVLFTLVNEKGYRETYPEQHFPFAADRNLQILELRPKENALVFYRGDTGSYWSMNLTTGRLEERFPSPFLKREKGVVRFNSEYAESWAWRDADMLAIVRERGKQHAILVGNPSPGHNLREVTRGPNRLWSLQWSTPEWLAYTVRPDDGCEPSTPPQLWAVNIRSGEKRLLVSEDLKRRIVRQFLDDLSRRKAAANQARESGRVSLQGQREATAP